MTGRVSDDERLRRWTLVLGAAAVDDTDDSSSPMPPLSADDRRIDAALAAVYDQTPGGRRRSGRSGGLGKSSPSVARWLGDIRRYFPSTVVQVMQADAIERLKLTRLLLEPELLDAVEPDVHLVGTLLSLNRVMPERSKRAARAVVARVVADLERRVAQRTRTALTGATWRSLRRRAAARACT